MENATVRSLRLDVPGWPGHLAGQHVDLRLTAEDGYQAQRSYSIASGPEDDRVVLTVERLADGEPVMLVAGGSGIVPLRAMTRHWAALGGPVPVRLLASWRSPDDAIYAAELDRLAAAGDGFETVTTFTRSQPPGWAGEVGRVTPDMLGRVAWPSDGRPLAFVCGPTGFVEAVASGLVALGYEPGRVRTERFGPTGAPDG
jgi:ferredoxin-NADP reductase